MYYMDNAALEKPSEKVITYANELMCNYWQNPNSIYQSGQCTKLIIEDTKQKIANCINCNPKDIIFCSCASEANSLATLGYIHKYKKDYFITSTIEHASILENPYAMKIVNVDKYGFFDTYDVKSIRNSLVSLQFANSEIGTMQSIQEIVKILHSNNCVVHTDAVAAFGKVPINVKELDVDMMTASSQKIGGLLGCAFLYKKDNIELEPLIFGHDTLRGGTPNVLSIGCFGKAIEDINYDNLAFSKDYVYDYIQHNIKKCYVVGSEKHRIPTNLNVCFKGVNNEALMTLLDTYNIQIATGSACNSGSQESSKVLQAIGIDQQDIFSCIRVSFTGKETFEELDYFCNTLKHCVEMLRMINDL